MNKSKKIWMIKLFYNYINVISHWGLQPGLLNYFPNNEIILVKLPIAMDLLTFLSFQIVVTCYIRQ